MAEVAARRALPTLLLELGAWLGASGTFLYLYINKFDAPASAVMPHLKLVFFYWLLWAALRMLNWRWMRPERLARAMASALLLMPWLLLAGWYLIAFIGLASWGRVTTWPMITTYAIQSPYLLDTLGVPRVVLFACLLLATALPLLLAFRWVGRVDWARWATQGRRSTISTLAAILACLVFAVELFQLNSFPPTNLKEPVSLSFFAQQGGRRQQGHNLGASPVLEAKEATARDAYQVTQDFKARNVILIVGDALRANHMSTYGYRRDTTPHIQAIFSQQQGFAISGTRSVCAESTCGLLGLASSRPIHAMTNRPFTVHDVLRLHGYSVHMILSGDHTNFYGLKEAYGKVDSYSDGTDQTHRYINDDQLVLDRVNELPVDAGGKQMFQFHLMSTHGLGLRHQLAEKFLPFTNYYRFPKSGVAPSDAYIPKGINYYDNGVVQFDQIVGALLDTLEKKGYLDDAVVIITGDHGEELGEHGMFSHAQQVYESALSVPMIMIRYGYHGSAVRAPQLSSQMDIAPTILGELGITIPAIWQGLPLQQSKHHETVPFQQSNLIGVYDLRQPLHPMKYWKDLRTEKEYLFDLSNDPNEMTNVATSADPRLLTYLRQLVMPGEFAAPDAARKSPY